MSEPMSFARVRIVHGDVSMCVEAPTGRLTTMDLSALHAPDAPLPPKPGKGRLAVAALAGCAAGVVMATLFLARPVAFASPDAFTDWFGEPPPPPFAMPAMPAMPLPQPSVPAAPAGTGSNTGTGTGTGTDPFGLKR